MDSRSQQYTVTIEKTSNPPTTPATNTSQKSNRKFEYNITKLKSIRFLNLLKFSVQNQKSVHGTHTKRILVIYKSCKLFLFFEFIAYNNQVSSQIT